MNAFSTDFNGLNLAAVPYVTNDGMNSIRVYDLDKQFMAHELFTDYPVNENQAHSKSAKTI